MFLTAKIIHYLILPPGSFILLILFVLFLLSKKYYKTAKVILILFVIFLYLISTGPFSNFLLMPLEESYPVYNNKKADFIVILGGGTVHNSPDEKGLGSLSPDPLKRVLYGFRIYKQTKLPIIISGGRVFDPDYVETEAEITKRFLVDLGVDENKIFVEGDSRNTWENSKFVKTKFKARSVILVTSAYHMKRSVFCFKKNLVDVVTAPTDFKARRIKHTIKSYLPNIRYFNNSYYAIREYIGLLFYEIKY